LAEHPAVRGIVTGGRQPDFNPTDVGVGLGTSQGVILGVIAGGLVVVTLAWRRSRPIDAKPSAAADRGAM
jgi:hypothetical protein